MNKDKTDLILMEYQRFSELFWRNEEVGEKRLNYFLSLATAVLAGLTALATSEFARDHARAVFAIAFGALSALFAIGVLTYLRMRRRDSVTEGYKATLDDLHERFLAACGEEHFALQFTGKKRDWGDTFKHGGLSAMAFSLTGFVALALLVTLIMVAWS